MWTEIIADTLTQSGHQVEYCFHNHKRTGDRLALLGSRLLPNVDRRSAWAQRYRKQLYRQLDRFRPDVLFSIQGKVDAETVNRLREKTMILLTRTRPHLLTTHPGSPVENEKSWDSPRARGLAEEGRVLAVPKPRPRHSP